jgi:hypothetical protein
MVYDTRDYWVFEFCPSSVIENTAFRKLNLVSSSGKGEKAPTLLGPLERANLSHSRICPVSDTLRSVEHQRMDKDQNPSDSWYMFS